MILFSCRRRKQFFCEMYKKRALPGSGERPLHFIEKRREKRRLRTVCSILLPRAFWRSLKTLPWRRKKRMKLYFDKFGIGKRGFYFRRKGVIGNYARARRKIAEKINTAFRIAGKFIAVHKKIRFFRLLHHGCHQRHRRVFAEIHFAVFRCRRGGKKQFVRAVFQHGFRGFRAPDHCGRFDDFPAENDGSDFHLRNSCRQRDVVGDNGKILFFGEKLPDVFRGGTCVDEYRFSVADQFRRFFIQF